jgi:cell division septum initiation protein DivIVA
MTHANSELLTPERVRLAAFTPARLGRRGLDESEVRSFCEWVSDGLRQLLNDNSMLQAEVLRLRGRLLDGEGNHGVQPEDAHVQAVHVLSMAQQTADRYVADAQEYSRELAGDARMRRDEIVREAKVRASMILEQAHTSASEAAGAVRATRDPVPAAERQELQAEIAYLRTFSDVCRTHLRAYMESLTRSIEEWERAERNGALTARDSALHSSQHVLPPNGRNPAGKRCKSRWAGSSCGMLRIRRWFGKRRQVIWAEPELPPFVKVNPMAAAVPTDTIQPGDITMGIMAREFLDIPDEYPQ